MPKHSRAKKRGKGPNPRGIGAHSTTKSSWKKVETLAETESNNPTKARHWPGVLAGLLVLVCAAGIIGVLYYQSAHSNNSLDKAPNATPEAVSKQKDAPKDEKASQSSRSYGANESTIRTETSKEAESMLDEIEYATFDEIPDTDDIAPFSLRKSAVIPALSSETCAALNAALEPIYDSGVICGFVFVDMDSGSGIAYNAYEPVYSASTFKAPYSVFVLQSGEQTSDYDLQNIEAALLYSDNNAYDALHIHDGEAYMEWLDAHGIDRDAAWISYYPDVSARQLVGMWVEIYRFLHSDNELGSWMAELLKTTNISFIRDGLKDTNAQVQNKAGWITDYEYGSAVNDAAIIEADGHTYLMAIVTTQPTTDECHERVSVLARTLWDARQALA